MSIIPPHMEQQMKKQQEEQEQKEVDAFRVEIQAVEEKHQRKIVAFIDYSPQGITPRMVAIKQQKQTTEGAVSAKVDNA